MNPAGPDLNLSAMRLLAAGLHTASPSAIPILSTTSCQNCRDTPISTQLTENTTTPAVTVVVRSSSLQWW